MALSQRLEFRQTQGLVMTPQLMQAIKLLQLSVSTWRPTWKASLNVTRSLSGRTTRNRQPRMPKQRLAGKRRRWSCQFGLDGSCPETSRSSMEQGLGTELENVFPDDGGEKIPQSGENAAPAYSEWSGATSGGVEDYNLEAFVSVETSLPITSPSKWPWQFPARQGE